jgi:hypothetical protein
MSKVKVRTQSRALHAALRDAGMKKKKAAKVANAFDATYTAAERTQQRKEAGRKGGKAMALKQKAAKKSPSGARRSLRPGATRRFRHGSAPEVSAKQARLAIFRAARRRHDGSNL